MLNVVIVSVVDSVCWCSIGLLVSRCFIDVSNVW